MPMPVQPESGPIIRTVHAVDLVSDPDCYDEPETLRVVRWAERDSEWSTGNTYRLSDEVRLAVPTWSDERGWHEAPAQRLTLVGGRIRWAS